MKFSDHREIELIANPRKRSVPSLRWWIGGLLFASTVINYIDRQTLSLLAPFLKLEYHWSNTDYANLVIAFRIAYSIGQTVFGRFMDRVGTRRGLSISVAFYSLVSMLTPLARGLGSFAFFRFLLGAGESANWPAATKAVSEWFRNMSADWRRLFSIADHRLAARSHRSSFCGFIFDGDGVQHLSSQGLLGLLWLVVWRRFYYPPEQHPLISEAERRMLAADKEGYEQGANARPRWQDLLKLPQTWGTIIAKTFTDPVWFFVTDWFPIYLVAKGIELRSGLLAVWVPFIAADLGNFFGGGVSGYLIKRGWPLGAARKAVVVFGGIGVTLLIPTIFTTNLYVITVLFGLATFCYASFSTIANVLPSDLYPSQSVATVSGFSGTGAGLGTILAFKLIGHYSDSRQAMATHSFDPIVIVAGLIPLVGMVLVLILVRNTEATRQGLVRPI